MDRARENGNSFSGRPPIIVLKGCNDETIERIFSTPNRTFCSTNVRTGDNQINGPTTRDHTKATGRKMNTTNFDEPNSATEGKSIVAAPDKFDSDCNGNTILVTGQKYSWENVSDESFMKMETCCLRYSEDFTVPIGSSTVIQKTVDCSKALIADENANFRRDQFNDTLELANFVLDTVTGCPNLPELSASRIRALEDMSKSATEQL